jgi:hypothetical protein
MKTALDCRFYVSVPIFNTAKNASWGIPLRRRRISDSIDMDMCASAAVFVAIIQHRSDFSESGD